MPKTLDAIAHEDCFYEEGREAYEEGADLKDCPYDEGTDGQEGWKKGWFGADKKHVHLPEKRNFFVINTCGYEEYSPRWFMTTKSEEEFIECYKQALHYAIEKVDKEDDGFISGYELLNPITVYMTQNGFQEIRANKEITIRGECLYNHCESDPDDSGEKPDFITDEDWKLILAHNQKVHDELHERHHGENTTEHPSTNG